MLKFKVFCWRSGGPFNCACCVSGRCWTDKKKSNVHNTMPAFLQQGPNQVELFGYVKST